MQKAANPRYDILPPMSKLSTRDAHVSEGLRLFNDGKYFEAHEALETAWRAENGQIRDLYRGILQVAVCYLHISRRNYAGAMKLYDRSQKWLAPWPDVMLGIHVGQLRADFEAAGAELKRLGPEGIESFDPALLKPIVYEQASSEGQPHHTKPSARTEGMIICDRCGTVMVTRNCKITCPNCGNRFDCSDLNIHFD